MTFLTLEYKVNAFQTQRNVYSYCTVAVVFTSTGLISWGVVLNRGGSGRHRRTEWFPLVP